MFGNLEYVTDARGDLIFTGFSALPEAPENPETSTSGSPSDPIPGTSLTPDLASSLDVTSMAEDRESTSTELASLASDPASSLVATSASEHQELTPGRTRPSHHHTRGRL